MGQLVKVKEGLEDEELGDYINKLGLVLRDCRSIPEIPEVPAVECEGEGLWEILIAGRHFIFNEEWLVPWSGPSNV